MDNSENYNLPTEQVTNNEQQANASVSSNHQPVEKKSKKTLFILIGALVIGIIIFVVIVFSIISIFVNSSDKLVCKSDQGNITLSYNEKTVTGYTASGITYKLEEQQKIAEQIGIDSYLEEFEKWFTTNTTGSCSNIKHD